MALELNYPRARGFAMLGAALMLAAHPDHEISLRILREFGDYLRGLLVQNRREGWYWFEDNLSYDNARLPRSEEHTSELQSLMRISYAVFCLKKKNKKYTRQHIKNT